ncbi:MAG: hypothetical protein Q4G62_10640, partial [Pseudomonadota bacterium]|nr:hypothetical protein [Pseudomonadota bacterium]
MFDVSLLIRKASIATFIAQGDRWIASIGMSLLAIALCTTPVHAQSELYSYQTNGYEMAKSNSVKPISGLGQFGEEIDFNSGSATFRKTVVDIPGNNVLRVAVDYTYRLSPLSPGAAPTFQFERDLPFIEGMHGFYEGWVVGKPGSYTNQRCSHWRAKLGAADLRSHGPYPETFLRDEYWEGNRLVINGSGGVLSAFTSPPSEISDVTTHWATNSQWRFSCYTLPDGSEGFVGHSPDGLKYYFGIPQLYGHPIWVTSTFSAPEKSWIEVNPYRMYLTRVEDRFGNWVKYEPTHVVSSDGRRITIETSPNGVTLRANGRAWIVQGNGQLTTITNPDGSTWSAQQIQYSLTSNILLDNWGEGCSIFPAYEAYRGSTVVAVTIESGAKGTFLFEPRRHGYSHVPYECHPRAGHFSWYLKHPGILDEVSLVSRKVEGPGIISYTHTIDYGATNACFAAGPSHPSSPTQRCTDQSATTRTVTINGPNGYWRQLVFGNRFMVDAGVLLSDRTGGLIVKNFTHSNRGGSTNGYGKTRIGYNMNDYAILRVERTTSTQSGVDFVRHVNNFDEHHYPLSVSRWSSLGHSKTDTFEYHHDTNIWILGLLKNSSTNGVVTTRTEFGSRSLPERNFIFGKLKQIFSYHIDGTLATITNGRGNATALSNWYRGIPQNIAYADSTTQSAV